jgi:hypothetical protein
MSEEAWQEMHSEPELGIYGGSTKGKQVSHVIFWLVLLIFNF